MNSLALKERRKDRMTSEPVLNEILESLTKIEDLFKDISDLMKVIVETETIEGEETETSSNDAGTNFS
jgi:hypothetical protein